MQSYPSLLHPESAAHPSTNANARIQDFYVNKIAPAITKKVKVSAGNAERDDGNYGSSATRDVEVLQALSRRIHFGMSLLLDLNNQYLMNRTDGHRDVCI